MQPPTLRSEVRAATARDVDVRRRVLVLGLILALLLLLL
jgi:hypothetical protein